MRVTQILFKQRIGWHFQKHWRTQGKRKILDMGTDRVLKSKGIAVEDANEFLKGLLVSKPERVEVVGFKDKPQRFDETHPNWHDQILLTYKDNNVLLEGLTQAKILTNTVQIKDGLPDKYELPDIKRDFNRRVKKIILGANIFDSELKILPKIKDPERPAFNFPRVYGVSQNRVFKLLINKLLNLIELSTDLNIVNQRYLVDNVYFSYPFERSGDPIQFQVQGDIVLLSQKPLGPITNDNVNEFELPDLFPIKPTVTLNEEHIYVMENVYSINKTALKHHPHTLFINFDKDNVKNLFEEEVTEEQIYGRTLIKAFTAAASYAQEEYGKDIKKLPSPVTIQAIQTDGRKFYFGVFQLNTLDLGSSDTRNIWCQIPALTLFDKCAYQLGKPVLEGYNKEVIKHLISFYNSS